MKRKLKTLTLNLIYSNILKWSDYRNGNIANIKVKNKQLIEANELNDVKLFDQRSLVF